MIHFVFAQTETIPLTMTVLDLDTRLPEIDDFERLFLQDIPMLDVRAPVEFVEGAFPASSNEPLLDDLQRHEVGKTYKERGQEAAILQGLALVSGNIKQQRISAWEAFARSHPEGVLYCFRGGMRSKITQQWLYEATGIRYPRVRGGYKALRRYLIDQLAANAAQMQPVVIGGRTGVGKTRFLKQLRPHLDLEGLAWHRGSAFGRHASPQPSQINFENALSIAILRLVKQGNPWFIAEDESRNIGARHIPMAFFEHFSRAPVIVLEADLCERIAITHQEYIVDALDEYISLHGGQAGWEAWANYLRDSLFRIRKRLGGVEYQRISRLQEDALSIHQRTGETESHNAWIEALLSNYYDAMYSYQLEQKKDRICFTGDRESVRQYLSDNYDIQTL